jgi:hypothetical protein
VPTQRVPVNIGAFDRAAENQRTDQDIRSALKAQRNCSKDRCALNCRGSRAVSGRSAAGLCRLRQPVMLRGLLNG